MKLEEHDLIGIFKMEGLWTIDLTSLSLSFLQAGSSLVVIIIWMYKTSPLPSLVSGFFFLLDLVICLTVVAHLTLPGPDPMAPSVALSLAISVVHFRGIGWYIQLPTHPGPFIPLQPYESSVFNMTHLLIMKRIYSFVNNETTGK